MLMDRHVTELVRLDVPSLGGEPYHPAVLSIFANIFLPKLDHLRDPRS
jgi:hypothetical protein